MSFGNYNTTPSANTSIAGKSLADGSTAPSTLNDAVRQLMADGRALHNTVAALNLTAYVRRDTSVLSPAAKVENRGSVLHHADPANASGRVFIQSESAALPDLQDGDVVFLV